MSLTNLRWWQWFVISLIIGPILGFVFSQQPVDDPLLPSTSLGDFTRKLQLRTDNGESILTSIRVSPTVLDNAHHPTQAVTFWERMRRKSTGQFEPVRQWRLYTPVPLFAQAPRPDYGILDYLQDKKKDFPTLDFGLRWWQTPRNMYLLCIGGSVLVIGVLWPILLRVLAKMGLIAAPAEGFDLSGVQGSSDIPSHVRTGVSEVDRDKLDSLNDQLQANVSGMSVDSQQGSQNDAQAEKAIRDLPNAPDETIALTGPRKPGDDEYQGEYYPVVKPTGKKT